MNDLRIGSAYFKISPGSVFGYVVSFWEEEGQLFVCLIYEDLTLIRSQKVDDEFLKNHELQQFWVAEDYLGKLLRLEHKTRGVVYEVSWRGD